MPKNPSPHPPPPRLPGINTLILIQIKKMFEDMEPLGCWLVFVRRRKLSELYSLIHHPFH